MDNDRYFLELALEEARIASKGGSIPIGAVLVGPDGDILSRGHNRVYTMHDPSWHAEIDVIRQSGKLLMDKKYKNKCTLYSSVEPCPMCSGALILSDIHRVVWALSDNYLGALRIMKDGQHFRHKFDKISSSPEPYHDLALQSEALMKEWNVNRGIPYVVSSVHTNNK
ncbi:tRNA(adenine34) deaminase [Paenibacillus sp. 1_12]|uniref:nucleoside deaminase n=1 Tax=Paenibacillus sp. 1_12 TaxID=1566278 RepID=UPI0008E07F45|nr:nucleoside deaminase [Paenibacillus sp. 1_12]SFL80262.1 tRNA(adenine34) deaminase [Paenibacillus sp. 1_12]